jgi:hypothetical protein
MATPEERITVSDPVEVVALPTSGRTVQGTPRKMTPEERQEMRRRLAGEPQPEPASTDN